MFFFVRTFDNFLQKWKRTDLSILQWLHGDVHQFILFFKEFQSGSKRLELMD